MKKMARRFCAFALALAMVVGSLSGLEADAAKKKPKFQTKSMKLTVGTTKKLTVKNAKKYKLSWKVKNKKLVKLKKYGKYGKKVTAKKVGSTTITCTAKKGKKKYVLKCKVNVVKKKKKKPTPVVVTPIPTTGPVVTPKPTVAPTATPKPVITPKPTATPVLKPTADPNFTPKPYKEGSFETGTEGFVKRGGSEVLKSSDGGYSGKCLSVSGRTQSWNGASLDLTDSVVKGAVYQVTAWVKQTSGSNQTMKVSCTLSTGGGTTYPAIGTVETKSGEWTKFESTYLVPKGFSNISIYFESAEGTFDFFIDEFSMTQVSEGAPVIDPLTLPSLKDTYAELFPYMGTCISTRQLQDSKLMPSVLRHYNSITLENEMKPSGILGSNSTMSVETAKGSAYGYSIPDNYTENIVPVLNFTAVDKAIQAAYDNGMKMRAHTLLWHQQTPDKFFKTNYSASGTVVSKAVMDARLEFYVRTVVSHVLQKEKEIAGKAGSIVYAWDVVNEYTHRSNNPTSASWVSVYGDMKSAPTYVKDAYVYAYDELKKENVENDVTLFYNDYNTYDEVDAIISLVNYINKDGKICKGVGMQAHLDVAYPTVEKFCATIDKFNAAGLEIQITELDVTINFNNANGHTDADQAEYFGKLMTKIIEKKRGGANITGITFWGLYDAVSWRSKNVPLLFSSGMDDPKESFYRVIEAMKPTL